MYTRTLEIRCDDCERQFQMQTLVDSKDEPLDLANLGLVCPNRMIGIGSHDAETFTILSHVITPFDIDLPMPANIEVRKRQKDTVMERMIEDWKAEDAAEQAAQAEQERQEEEERFFNEALAAFQSANPQGTFAEFKALYPKLREQVMLERTMQRMTDRPERLF